MTSERSILKSINPHVKHLGGFDVRRSIPQIGQRSIGPWVFFDHFGSVDFLPGDGINVRPHPHINLATVTYLFEGEIYHRDSLGNALAIRPGAINLMVAGKGIVHSERTREAVKETGYKLHGLQLWHALPKSVEEIDPAFFHTSAEDIPCGHRKGVEYRVMMGEAYGLKSPVKTYSPILYLEAKMSAGSSLELPFADEMGVYVVNGQAEIDGEPSPVYTMSVLSDSAKLISAKSETRLAIIGGAALGKRYMEWNFISSRKDRIEQAKADWLQGRFDKIPNDDEEFIPLPE